MIVKTSKIVLRFTLSDRKRSKALWIKACKQPKYRNNTRHRTKAVTKLLKSPLTNYKQRNLHV